MPSKNLIAKPCPYNIFLSFLQESPSAPTKATRINCLPGLMSASAISEINCSVIMVSSRTKVIYPGEDGRRNMAVSLRSFWMASSVYWYIPSRCSNHISPPAKGRINDFFLTPGNSSGCLSAHPDVYLNLSFFINMVYLRHNKFYFCNLNACILCQYRFFMILIVKHTYNIII